MVCWNNFYASYKLAILKFSTDNKKNSCLVWIQIEAISDWGRHFLLYVCSNNETVLIKIVLSLLHRQAALYLEVVFKLFLAKKMN